MAYVEPEVLIELYNEGLIDDEEYEEQIEENFNILNDSSILD